ncbi:MAG: hypothetical protein GX663_07325 [Clostridiales bacterium]|nr:hypothetical protein [Clostridiales bacterium]
MAQGKLTPEEVKFLKENPNVVSVDEIRIIYSNEFKVHFMKEYLSGRKPTQIFREAGLGPESIGAKRIERSAARWRKRYAEGTLEKYPSYAAKSDGRK